MKSLLIVANPSKTSFTHALAEWYAKNHPDCEILDLYEVNQEIFSYESIQWLQKGEINGKNEREIIQKKISECGEMVFFFPVWWGSFPAILKNFFDSNFTSGFAFTFKDWWKQEKLLTDKTAKIYCHCDAPWFVYKIPFIVWINIKWYISKAILWFCWIKTTDFQLYWNITKWLSKTEKEKIISSI